MPLKTAVVVSDAIKDFFGIDIQLKWPNDLAYKNKKIGGILVESINSDGKFFVVIGVGINLRLDALETHWGDLNLTINEKERLKFIKFVFEKLSKINDDNFLSDWKERWEKKCFHMNQEILILPDEKKGVFLCIDTSGRMIVQLDGEKKVFSSSEVKIRNAY